MTNWECVIDGCGKRFDAVERAIEHQKRGHERRECRVCGALVPDGYPAIDHVFEEHTRAEYVRVYGADAEAIKVREKAKALIEEALAETNDNGDGSTTVRPSNPAE